MKALAVTPTEAGIMLGGLSDTTVRRMVRNGTLPTLAGVKRTLIPVVALEAYVAASAA